MQLARAVVVVEPGPGAVSICFDGSISGLDALQLAGANPVTYGFAGQGAAVCQLYGVGNPADQSCLIGPGGQYWAYFRAAPGAGGWTYSSRRCRQLHRGRRVGRGLAVRHRGRARLRLLLLGGELCAATHRPAPDRAARDRAPVAPAGPTASPAGGANGGAPAPGATATTAPSSSKDGKSGAGAESGTAAATSTTGGSGGNGTTGKRQARGAGDAVALGPGSGSGGDSGSPVGVVIAIVAVVLAAGTGLWVRHRRRGSAPG